MLDGKSNMDLIAVTLKYEGGQHVHVLENITYSRKKGHYQIN
jgi:hypothetical protein